MGWEWVRSGGRGGGEGHIHNITVRMLVRIFETMS